MVMLGITILNAIMRMIMTVRMLMVMAIMMIMIMIMNYDHEYGDGLGFDGDYQEYSDSEDFHDYVSNCNSDSVDDVED